MSVITGARKYADTAFDQGKSTVIATSVRGVSASGRLLALPAESKGVLLGVLDFARRQAYATIGASDAAVATVIKRSAELPTDAKQSAVTLSDTAKHQVDRVAELAGRAQDAVTSTAGGIVEGIKDRGVTAVGFVRDIDVVSSAAGARDDLQARLAQVADGFGKLADRGEQVATDLRHDPVLVRAIREADMGIEKAANSATSVAQKVRSRAERLTEQEQAATTSTPVRLPAPSQIPTHKTTVRHTPAGEAPISPTPAYRAAAQLTATRKAAAQQAAATRKAAAAEAAATRKAAAAKAAETRKQNAATAKQAATARKAAAVKAAQTRKENATARA